MSKKVISPSELTFHSFRHSQGSIASQLAIFRFVEIQTGLKPDLHPVSNEWKRYVAYLDRPDSKAHLHFDGTQKYTANNATYGGFKILRSYYNKRLRLNTAGPSANMWNLVDKTLSQEITILDQDEPWVNPDGKALTRPERLSRRVSSGMASFVLFHGRDQRTTGFDIFDLMYQKIWNVMLDPLAGSQSELVDRHTDVVAIAERTILGPNNLIQTVV